MQEYVGGIAFSALVTSDGKCRGVCEGCVYSGNCPQEYEWRYFEVFGLLQGDFEQLKEYYYKVLGEKFAFVENIDAVPTTKGKWTDAIITADNLYDSLGMIASMHGYVCSCCQDFSVARYKYCPNCGVKMEET